MIILKRNVLKKILTEWYRNMIVLIVMVNVLMTLYSCEINGLNIAEFTNLQIDEALAF